MPIEWTKYFIYEYYDDKDGVGYTGGNTLKEARATPWRKETSPERHISTRSKDYIQKSDGTVYKLYHVDFWIVKGKEKQLYGKPNLYETIDAAQKACQELLDKNPKGRKRNYITYSVRESEN